MINTENNSGVVKDGVKTIAHKQASSVVSNPQDKQPSSGVKKTALRDVQNRSDTGLNRGQSENLSFLGGGQNKDAAIKVCGSKRLTPEPPPVFPSLSNTCANELIMNARRRFELELGGGRIQSNGNKHLDSSLSRQSQNSQLGSPQKHIQPRINITYSVATDVSSNIIQPLTKPYGGASAPNFLGKHGSGMQVAQTDSVKVTTDCPRSNAFKATDDKQRVDRVIRLQKYLKDCDENNCRDYIMMLRHLPPSELSKHAVDLEKRAIHLTIEEGKEMERVNAFNVLGKPFSTSNSPQTLHVLQGRK